MEVRAAHAGDLWDLFQLRWSLHLGEGGKDHPLLMLRSLNALTSDLLSSSTTLFVVVDPKPVAFATYTRDPFVGSGEKIGRVEGVYVLPPYRRTKALWLLYQRVEFEAEAEGMVALQGFVLSANTESRMIWERRGAKQVGVVLEKRYVRRDTESVEDAQGRSASSSDPDRCEQPVPQRPHLCPDPRSD